MYVASALSNTTDGQWYGDGGNDVCPIGPIGPIGPTIGQSRFADWAIAFRRRPLEQQLAVHITPVLCEARAIIIIIAGEEKDEEVGADLENDRIIEAVVVAVV